MDELFFFFWEFVILIYESSLSYECISFCFNVFCFSFDAVETQKIRLIQIYFYFFTRCETLNLFLTFFFSFYQSSFELL